MTLAGQQDEPVRVGIVGLGRSGWNMHAAALTGHPGYRVAAVADPVAARRSEAAQLLGCATYVEASDVVSSTDVDTVVLATPSHTHHRLALDALAAGKHVVVEKPMAQSVAEIDEMIDAANEADRIITCFQQRRLEPALTAIQEIVASGRLGRLVLIHRVRNRFMRRADWQTLRKYGGGELANYGAHLIDQMLTLLGDSPTVAFTDLQHTVGAGDAEDHVKVCLRADSGVVADIEYSLCAAFPRDEWDVIGVEGGVHVSGDTLRVRWLDTDSLDPLSADEGPPADRSYHNGEQIAWREDTVDVKYDDTLLALRYYDRLHAALTGDGPVFVTPESVRRQIDVIERCRAQADPRLHVG